MPVLQMFFLVFGIAIAMPNASSILKPEQIPTSLSSNSSIIDHHVNADSISATNLTRIVASVTNPGRTTLDYLSSLVLSNANFTSSNVGFSPPNANLTSSNVNLASSNASLTSSNVNFSSSNADLTSSDDDLIPSSVPSGDEETAPEDSDSPSEFSTDDPVLETDDSPDDLEDDLANVTATTFNFSSPSLSEPSDVTRVDPPASLPSSIGSAIDDGQTTGTIPPKPSSSTEEPSTPGKKAFVTSHILNSALPSQGYAASMRSQPVLGSTNTTPKATPTTLAFITSTQRSSLSSRSPFPISFSSSKTGDLSSTIPPGTTVSSFKETAKTPIVEDVFASTLTSPSPSTRPGISKEMLGVDPKDELGYNFSEEDRAFFLPPTQANSVYFDFRRLCPEEHAGDVWWNRTYGGVIAVRFCPEGYTGKVYRMCYYGGNWGEVDFSECRVQQLIKLKHLLYYHVHKNLTEGFHSLADELLSSLLRFRLRSIDDYLESLDSLNIIINARVPLDFDVGLDFKYLKTILKISDILFSRFDNKWSFPQEQKEMVTMKMVQILHGMTHFGNLVAEGVKRSSRSVVVFTDYSHIGLEAKVIRGDQDYRVAPPGTGSSVHLPGRIYKVLGSNDKYVVVTTWYNRIAQSLHEDEGMVNSAIFATTVHPGHDLHLAAGPVTATLQIHEKIDGNYYAECGYLRRTYNKSSLWSNVGCSVTETQATSVTCICHHMANIAVLVRHRHIEGHVQWKPISLIVMIGCCISLAALLSTFVAHVHLLRYDSSESSLILLNLLLAMTAAQLVFMGGIQATSSREVCEGVSIVLHYLNLVSSFWLLSHGIHVYLSTRCKKEIPSGSHMRDYCLLSWAAPVVFVFVTFAVNPHGYEIRKYCWLSIERGMLLSYIVPIFCLITVNTTLMVLVLKHLFETQSAMKKFDIDKARTSVRAGVILLPYFGVNWFLGVLAMEDRSTEIFETIFAISTAVQGLLIFLFYCILQPEVRKAFRQFTSKVLRRRKSSDLKLRRSRRRGSKFDAEPLLIGHEICDYISSPSTTNLAAQCLPSPEEPFVLAEERET